MRPENAGRDRHNHPGEEALKRLRDFGFFVDVAQKDGAGLENGLHHR
jgi:hypothetical protein